MKKKWTEENLRLEALKFKRRVDFQKKRSGAYKAAMRLSILDEICIHMEQLRINWTQETLKIEALKYRTRGDFQKYGKNPYQVARRMGILDDICIHMKFIHRYWTPGSLHKEALKYLTRTKFYEGNPSAYGTALRLNIINEICSHMEHCHQNWTKDIVKEKALEYISRSIFQKESSNAYQAAIRLGILDKVCSHMNKPSNTSYSEKELFDEIKKQYSKTKKLKDCKVNIHDKPHIQGFEIDIYIPELKKGIEFDGTYWHSVEGLKRSRQGWSQGDLENYHQIKDDYFKSKGIELLHINEKNWLKNKEKCIQKCMKFLSNK